MQPPLPQFRPERLQHARPWTWALPALLSLTVLLTAWDVGPPAMLRAAEPDVALQQRRTFAFENDGVRITQDFPGGALADVRRAGPDHYEATIAPENKPINRSPWYAFQIIAQEQKKVTVTLTYAHGRHRYHPKISRDGNQFTPIDHERVQEDRDQGTARLTVDVGPKPVWIAAQELFTSQDYERWMQRLARKDAVGRDRIGQSRGGRPLSLLTIGQEACQQESEAAKARYVLLLGRQHPPELSGGVAMRAFIETLVADTELARRFRKMFCTLAVPLVNPDGVDRGFWRHNFGGKDLNRDWGPFTQPETRHVRDAFQQRLSDADGQVFVGIDFHSTFRNLFYTPSKQVDVEPENFVDDWLKAIRQQHPDVKLPESASHNPGGTTSKTWFVERFGVPGITYEVADDFDREATRAIARTAAKAMMRLLLDEASEPEASEPEASEPDAAKAGG